MFPKTQFTEDYILFVRGHFNVDNHCFVLYTNEDYSLNDSVYNISGVYDYDKENILKLFKRLRAAEAIILHNLGLPFKELLFLSIDKRIISKCVWMIWGADLYCYRDSLENFGDYIVEGARRRIIRNLKWTATLTDGDYELLCGWYRCNAHNYRVEYISEKSIEQMKAKVTKDRVDSVVRIMVGNSATRSNCHMEVFGLLAKYKEENIQIIAPLSYGDMDYAKEVVAEGKRIFGEAFIPMREFIPKDEYYDFLYSIDIGVFNNNRQEATGNIQALMFYKRKVFIRKGTSLWNEWNDKAGYSIANVADIASMNYDTFKSVDEVAVENNYSKVFDYYDADARAKEWQTLFEDVCKKQGNR